VVLALVYQGGLRDSCSGLYARCGGYVIMLVACNTPHEYARGVCTNKLCHHFGRFYWPVQGMETADKKVCPKCGFKTIARDWMGLIDIQRS